MPYSHMAHFYACLCGFSAKSLPWTSLPALDVFVPGASADLRIGKRILLNILKCLVDTFYETYETFLPCGALNLRGGYYVE
jgi:hypothetical protein